MNAMLYVVSPAGVACGNARRRTRKKEMNMPSKPRARSATVHAHPLEHTTASVMLAAAVDASSKSMTELGLAMGYNNRSSLSHMASGMAPIPIGNAERIAAVVGLDEGAFTMAVLHQRHPEAADVLMATHRPGETLVLDEALLQRLRSRLRLQEPGFAEKAMKHLSLPLPWDGVATDLAGL